MREFERRRTQEHIREEPSEQPENKIVFEGEPNPQDLERITGKDKPTYPLPASTRVPSAVKKKELIDAFGEKIIVLVEPIDNSTMFMKHGEKTVKYTLLEKLEPPTADLFYGIYFTNTVYYYVPAGKEYQALLNGENINPNTHYLVDFENGRIYEHPLGLLQTENRDNPKIKKLIQILKPKGEYKNYVF